MKIIVVMPTYNESRTIADLVRQVQNQNLEILVIDDGSSDDTFTIAKDNMAVVLRNEKNLGKGASLTKGFDYALKAGFDAVITMDSDGQHSPEDIAHFRRIFESSHSGMFIGNRMLSTKNMPLIRILTNKLMSWVISRAAGQNVPDTQCGFRLIRKEVLEKIVLKSSNYEIESEMIIRAARQGFKIESIPIKTIYSREKSRVNPFIDTIRFFCFIIPELWTTRH